MDIEKLKRVYEDNTNESAARIIGVSVPTLLKKIDDAGIERKGSGRPYKDLKKDGLKVNIYLASGLMNEFPFLKSAMFGFFIYLLTDKLFASNQWNGKSMVNIDHKYYKESPETIISYLNTMKDGNIIKDFSVDNDGFITAYIIERKRFAITEAEYLQEIEK